ncbi:MAG: hypothetical protein M3R38_12750 [Actinomycetota bacterium]|nr:hypothetical protein [Actinomycetota bacterium]
MPTASTLGARQIEALQEIRAVLEEHAPQEAETLRLLGPDGRVPNSIKSPVEFDAFLAQSVAILARLYDQQAKALAPKPRGRPPKTS